MRIFRKLQVSLVTFLVFAGALIVVGDLLFIRRYGVDYNDVAFVTRNDDVADWPTGERPLYAHLPAAGYGLVAWFVAALVLVPWPEMPKGHHSAARRGTE